VASRRGDFVRFCGVLWIGGFVVVVWSVIETDQPGKNGRKNLPDKQAKNRQILKKF
jgi:hypothetical protein